MDPSDKRKILRRAERAFEDENARERLAEEGIYVGNTKEVDPEEFLEWLESEPDDGRPSVTVTLYFDQTPVGDRSEIEEPLSTFVERKHLGEWIGSGQGSIGERTFFDVTFVVDDLSRAISALQSKLRELGVGRNTEISASDGSGHQVY